MVMPKTFQALCRLFENKRPVRQAMGFPGRGELVPVEEQSRPMEHRVRSICTSLPLVIHPFPSRLAEEAGCFTRVLELAF